MRSAVTHPVRSAPARTMARLCAALCVLQLAVAHAQPPATPQPLWLVPWAGPVQPPVLPFPTPFWLWPVPWSMPLAPVWLPHGLPTPQPAPAVPPGDGGRAAKPVAPAIVVAPPPAADTATGGDTPETRAPLAETPVVDIRAAEVAPGHAVDAGTVTHIDAPAQEPAKAETVTAEPAATPTPPVAAAPTTDTVTTGAPAAEAAPPKSTPKAKPAPRLKPLPPPKTLGSGTRADTARQDGKARKLCWRDGKLDVCP